MEIKGKTQVSSLAIGGTGSGNPLLKSDGTNLLIRKGDDTDYLTTYVGALVQSRGTGSLINTLNSNEASGSGAAWMEFQRSSTKKWVSGLAPWTFSDDYEIASAGALRFVISAADGSITVKQKLFVGNALNILNLPTSSVGLSTGDVWVDTTGGNNILKIK